MHNFKPRMRHIKLEHLEYHQKVGEIMHLFFLKSFQDNQLFWIPCVLSDFLNAAKG